jgi:AmmeMemoRadiSam system protein B
MEEPIRRPAVAGRFYPADAGELRADVEAYARPGAQRGQAIGCMVPHAGYIYSGHVAGAVFARLELPRRIIIVCPNHTGMGKPLAITSEGKWQTPLGEATVDRELAAELKREFSLLEDDVYAHLAEHSLEVQLPFLQVLRQDFSFVPICIGTGGYEVPAQLGESVAKVISRLNEPVLIIASSDMNHYETDPVTRRKDHKAIEPMLACDARGLFDTVKRERISMCGYGAAVAMLTAAHRLGRRRAELVKYGTSADISEDREVVVGYAGLVVA